MKKGLIHLLIISGLLSAFADAEQLSFDRNAGNYNYLWNDQQGKQQQIGFSLLNYPHHLTKFTQYRPQHAQQYVLSQLKSSLSNIDPKQARVTFNTQNDQLSYQLQGNDQALLKEINTQLHQDIEQHYQNYLNQQYFVEQRTVDGSIGIMPDHNRLAKESAEYLTSWLNSSLNALGDKESSPREVTNYLLGFVQSIPYNQLRSKDNLRGAGYLTPIQVIRNNVGDCDSKSTLIASALKTAFPRLDIAIIYVPNHALIALAIPARASDETVEIRGKKFVLAEPTGPALFQLGKVAKSSSQYIHSGLYTYQRIDWEPPKFKRVK
ncbi:hypothetical protein AHAT_23480 [Agarivorans sp. Toyoura001]|uniref:hypothetical protein n=1 Tax=Agarivorans sp. Toyoura001 TaxID=2283141 RepID=UPI0010E24259|nr:hypothetical protein [Agarivorans sp. Toyoura001]GDY26458.1 hypothetical protein AHAT_23480 [Agarivorans sp. Toyoura001]